MRYIIFTFLIIATASCHRTDKIRPDESGLFMKFFGGAGNEIAYAAEETPDGGYILVGSTASPLTGVKNALIIKTDKNGNKIWEKTVGGEKNGEARDVKVGSDGSYVVLGYCTNADGFTDFLLMRFNSGGAVLDSLTFGMGERNEIGTYIKITEDKNYLLGGIVTNEDNTSDMYFVKTDLSSKLWERKYGLVGEMDEIGSIDEIENGNLIICGTVRRGGTTDMRVVKADPFGNLMWDYAFGFGNNRNETGKCLKVLADGYIVVGTSYDTPDGKGDVFLVKLNRQGISQWEKKIGGAGEQIGNSIDLTGDNGYIITGSSEKSQDHHNIYLLKVNSEGNTSWEESFGGGGMNSGNYVKTTKDKGYLILGTTDIVNNSIINMIKTNASGRLTN
ncbi:MAG: hypothetical protein ACK4ND_16120 [Cytophagaceae bacterium]